MPPRSLRSSSSSPPPHPPSRRRNQPRAMAGSKPPSPARDSLPAAVEVGCGNSSCRTMRNFGTRLTRARRRQPTTMAMLLLVTTRAQNFSGLPVPPAARTGGVPGSGTNAVPTARAQRRPSPLASLNTAPSWPDVPQHKARGRRVLVCTAPLVMLKHAPEEWIRPCRLGQANSRYMAQGT